MFPSVHEKFNYVAGIIQDVRNLNLYVKYVYVPSL